MDPQTEEAVARAMRDALFECATTDNNWEACKGHYIRNWQQFERKLAELGLRVIELDGPDDPEFEAFLKEYREGKHPLSDADREAMERMRPKLLERLKQLLGEKRN